jgi:hypothetical protein
MLSTGHNWTRQGIGTTKLQCEKCLLWSDQIAIFPTCPEHPPLHRLILAHLEDEDEGRTC